MIKICVLGDIGSGKSYVAEQFGYPVFNADKEVEKIYKKNKKCFIKLNQILPKYIFSFPIKKKELSKAILNKKKNLKKITKIVHPIVRAKMNQFVKKNKNKKFVVLDVPLLIENKLNKKNDILIFVEAKKKNILKRLKLRKNYNLLLLKRLNTLQLKLEEKRKKCHYVIKNDFKKFTIKKSVKVIKYKI